MQYKEFIMTLTVKQQPQLEVPAYSPPPSEQKKQNPLAQFLLFLWDGLSGLIQSLIHRVQGNGSHKPTEEFSQDAFKNLKRPRNQITTEREMKKLAANGTLQVLTQKLTQIETKYSDSPLSAELVAHIDEEISAARLTAEKQGQNADESVEGEFVKAVRNLVSLCVLNLALPFATIDLEDENTSSFSKEQKEAIFDAMEGATNFAKAHKEHLDADEIEKLEVSVHNVSKLLSNVD